MSDKITIVPQQPQKTLTKFSDIKEVPEVVLNLGKDSYLLWKDRYDSSSWTSSYPLWANLYDSDRLFWCNFTLEMHFRCNQARI